MIADNIAEHLVVQPSADRMSATLRILPGAPFGKITREILLEACAENNIAENTIDTDVVDALLEEFNTKPGKQAESVVAQGIPPEHGRPGVLELDPELAERLKAAEKLRENPKRKAASAPAPRKGGKAGDQQPGDDADDAVDHYSTSAFVIVERGQHLGRITEPTKGTDGSDVHGEKIPANPGRRVSLEEHPSIEIRDDDTICSRVRGYVVARAGRVYVESELRIRTPVNFSTGNISFPGDVQVDEGVKDRFRVRSDRSIRVLRLVEAARIEAGLDIRLSTGAAGRGQGHIEAGRDLIAGYLDAVTLRAGRDCLVDREITNCQADVARRLAVPGGILRGGVYRCGIACEASMIGASGGSETTIELGRPPELCKMIEQLGKTAREAEAFARHAEEEFERFPRADKLSASQVEMLRELEFRAESAREAIAPINQARSQLDELCRTLPLPTLEWKRILEEGTIVCIGPYRLIADRPVKGPLRLDLPREGPPEIRDIATGTVSPASTMFDVFLEPGVLDLRLPLRGPEPPRKAA